MDEEEREDFKIRLRQRIFSKHMLIPLSVMLILLSGIWEDNAFIKWVSTFFAVGLCVFLFLAEWFIDLEDGNA